MTVLHLPSWFPNARKPLDGNFILRHIAAIAPLADCIVMRHVDTTSDFECPIPPNVRFVPVKMRKDAGKRKIFKAYLNQFDEIVKKYGRPDIIHLHVALPLGPAAACLSRKYHIPLIISEHWSIYQPQNRSQIGFAQRQMLRYTYRRADGLTAVSQNLAGAIRATVACAGNIPTRVIGNVADTDLFRPSDSPAPAHSKKRMLHISSLENATKNIMGILRATAQVASMRRDFVLDIIHDLPNPEVNDFIENNHLQDCIRLLGKKEERQVAEALQQVDFLLHFSNYENQPCVLLEAFSCGKPAITTPVGGIPEIANAGNAIFAEPRNESQLVDKINFMLDHSGTFNPQVIRKDIVSKCAPQNIGNQFNEFYKTILGL